MSTLYLGIHHLFNIAFMTFGKTLQKIRRKKEMSQREIAKKINMDFSYFSKLENDRFESKPTRETIEKIAQALNCTEEEKNELLAAAGRMNEEVEQVARLVNENPEKSLPLGKLFRAAVHLSPERLKELSAAVEAEAEKIITKNTGENNDD
jgi:transcriptional regulator with XRE-family HTH domain